MTKLELAQSVRSKTGLDSSVCIQAVEATIEAMGDSLANGESIFLRGFGTFKIVTRKAKVAQNIHKHEEVLVPEHNVVKFIQSDKLKVKQP